MKDLYRSLALAPSASVEAIRDRIEANPSLANAAVVRQVLLNPARKRVYDRAHSAAARIGKLEVELRLPTDELTRAFRTAGPSSWRELAVYAKANQPSLKKKNHHWILKLIAWLALPGGLYLISSLSKTSSTAKVTPTDSPPHVFSSAPPSAIPFNQPWVVFPASGSYKTHTNKALGAPFKIVTQVGDTNYYYCKLVNAHTGITEMELYVAGGMSAEFEVPLGTYRLKYAAGTIWYGEKYLFGDSTVCTEAKALFEFNVEGNRYIGNTVELYKRPGGNLQTQVIPRSDF